MNVYFANVAGAIDLPFGVVCQVRPKELCITRWSRCTMGSNNYLAGEEENGAAQCNTHGQYGTAVWT